MKHLQEWTCLCQVHCHACDLQEVSGLLFFVLDSNGTVDWNGALGTSCARLYVHSLNSSTLNDFAYIRALTHIVENRRGITPLGARVPIFPHDEWFQNMASAIEPPTSANTGTYIGLSVRAPTNHQDEVDHRFNCHHLCRPCGECLCVCNAGSGVDGFRSTGHNSCTHDIRRYRTHDNNRPLMNVKALSGKATPMLRTCSICLHTCAVLF